MKELTRVFVIGHPAAGKALFSKNLADRLGFQFIDADMGLEHGIGRKIDDILRKEGLASYNHTQEVILNSLSQKSGIVVGLDCHVGNSPQTLAYLKNACIIYLKTTVETQLRRSGSQVPLIGNENYEVLFKTLHSERDDFYNHISDMVLPADEGNIDKHIETFLAFLKDNDLIPVETVGPNDRELIFFKHKTDIPVRLSEQQAICLKYLSNGQSAKKIARLMDISHRTVEVYIAQLKERLECNSNKDLVSLYSSRH